MRDLFGDKQFKALSWKQPFASLMLHGKIETRTWPTAYRGEVLICASKKFYTEAEIMGIAGVNQTQRIFNTINERGIKEKLGYAIAIGNLVDCRLMTKADEAKCFVQYRPMWYEQRILKDGTSKLVEKRLWCHIYKNVRAINPMPWSGVQRWKDVPDSFSRLIMYL